MGREPAQGQRQQQTCSGASARIALTGEIFAPGNDVRRQWGGPWGPRRWRRRARRGGRSRAARRGSSAWPMPPRTPAGPPARRTATAVAPRRRRPSPWEGRGGSGNASRVLGCRLVQPRGEIWDFRCRAGDAGLSGFTVRTVEPSGGGWNLEAAQTRSLGLV